MARKAKASREESELHICSEGDRAERQKFVEVTPGQHEAKMVLERIKANLEADQRLVAQLEEAIAKQKDAG